MKLCWILHIRFPGTGGILIPVGGAFGYPAGENSRKEELCANSS